MKSIVDILKQFTKGQRLLVLVLLLITILLMGYFKQDDCRPIIQENLKMHEDFLKISQMLREERMKEFTIVNDSTIVHQDTIVLDKDALPPTPYPPNTIMDDIESIVNSNIKTGGTKE